MNNDIRQRLLSAEKDFLSAVSEGTLEHFQSSWSSLVAEVEAHSISSSIDPDTQVLACTIAKRIEVLAESLFQMQSTYDELTATFEAEIQQILQGADHEPATGNRLHTHSSHPPSNNRSPQYIEHAYKWLISNIHDPYPSKEALRGICQQSGCSRKVIGAWFVDARRRIGWTSLRRQHFSNKRVDIVRAATAFFKDHPTTERRPELNAKFLSISRAVHKLYSHRYSESALVVDIDSTSHLPTRAASAYPSPEPSPGLIPSPPSSPETLPLLDEDHDTSPPRVVERAAPLTEERRAAKRRRLPSPPPSHQSSPGTSNTSLPIVTSPNTHSKALRHHVSHSHMQQPSTPPPEPHLFISEPSSTPLPIVDPFEIGSWVPSAYVPATSGEELNATTPLDVQLYDYSALVKDFSAPNDLESSEWPQPFELETSHISGAFAQTDSSLWFDNAGSDSVLFSSATSSHSPYDLPPISQEPHISNTLIDQFDNWLKTLQGTISETTLTNVEGPTCSNQVLKKRTWEEAQETSHMLETTPPLL